MLSITLLLVVFGATYQTVGERRLARDHSPPGRLVSIGSRRLHLYCTGAGDPPVILVAGSGLAYNNWPAVQKGLSEVTRVCSYDRAGLGWSDPGPHQPSADGAVSDLYGLLTAAGIKGPWILVGHSLGGLYAQQFMNLHPEEVAALVLLDSTHEEQFERVPLLSSVTTEPPLSRLRTLLTVIGVHRLVYPPPEDDAHRAAYELHMTSKHMRTAAVEWWSMEKSAAQVRAARIPWRDVPLVVFSAGKQSLPSGWTEAEAAEAERIFHELNQELAARSSRGRHVVVEGSGHGIPWERPDVVIAAVHSLVQELRRADEVR